MHNFLLTPLLASLSTSAFALFPVQMWGSDNICIERNKKIWREKML